MQNKVKIINEDGTSQSTKVLNSDGGEIKFITSLNVSFSIDDVAKAQIELLMPRVEVFAEAEYIMPKLSEYSNDYLYKLNQAISKYLEEQKILMQPCEELHNIDLTDGKATQEELEIVKKQNSFFDSINKDIANNKTLYLVLFKATEEQLDLVAINYSRSGFEVQAIGKFGMIATIGGTHVKKIVKAKIKNDNRK